MADTYSLHIPASNETREFSSAKEAGAAYFDADRTKRPAVIHEMGDGRSARFMAETAVHGNYADGESKFVKRLPHTTGPYKAIDAEFRAGYMEALEKSVNERLKATDWEKARPEHNEQAPKLDNKLYDDLETLSRSNADKATKAWRDHAPEWTTPPAIVDPAWKQQVSEAKRTAELLDAERGPAYGITQIDSKPATAVRFERQEKDGEPTYNLSFMMDNKTVVRLKGLDSTDLENAVGDKNAQAIREAETDKGTLKGSALASEYGLSPEENARRIAIKEEQKQADFDRMQPDDPTEKNVVVHEPERLQTIDMDEALGRLARHREAERQQRLQMEQNQLATQAEGKRIKVENLSEKAVEQDNINRLAERSGDDPSYDGQIATEKEKHRQIELMEQVHRQFRVAGAKFHFKEQPAKVAFTDKGQRMVSASNDDRVAHAMATMAEAKGWKTIRVSGHPDFQREVWMEASLRGIQVRGFTPKEQDLKDLETRRERMAKNVVEREDTGQREKASERGQKMTEKRRQEEQAEKRRQDAQKDAGRDEQRTGAGVAGKVASAALRAYAGRVIAHGAANFNHDPKEKMNYFVKLETDKGEQTVWGVDLKRAMADSKAKEGDAVRLEFKAKQPVTVTALERDENGKVIGSKQIETNRNTWVVEKSDKHKVVEAVAAELVNQRFKDPAQRAEAMKAINQRLDERAKVGKVPDVPMYDKQAPSMKQQQERARPAVERNAERTR